MPRFMMIYRIDNDVGVAPAGGSTAGWFESCVWVTGTVRIVIKTDDATGGVSFRQSGQAVSWYHGSHASNQLNISGKAYCFVAVG